MLLSTNEFLLIDILTFLDNKTRNIKKFLLILKTNKKFLYVFTKVSIQKTTELYSLDIVTTFTFE